MRRTLHRLDGVHLFRRFLRRSYFFAQRDSRRLRAVSPSAHSRAPQGNRRRAAQRLSLVQQLAPFVRQKKPHYFINRRPCSRLSCPSFYGTNSALFEMPLEDLVFRPLHIFFRAVHFFFRRLRPRSSPIIRLSWPQTR